MILNLTDADYSAAIKESTKPVIVQFYAEWCGPCKMVTPVIEQFAKAHGDTALIIRVDTDHSPQIAAHYGVRNIPTTVLLGFSRHTKEYEQMEKIVGAQAPESLIQKLTDHVVRHPEMEKPKAPKIAAGDEMWKGPLNVPHLEDKSAKLITTIRRFRLQNSVGRLFDAVDANPRNSVNQMNKRYLSFTGEAGDIVEEIFDMPNHFINISLMKRMMDSQELSFRVFEKLISPARPFSVYDYNRLVDNNVIEAKKYHQEKIVQGIINIKKALVNMESIDDCDITESQLVATGYHGKKCLSSLKRKVKSIARLNEEVTMLKHILQIEDEE